MMLLNFFHRIKSFKNHLRGFVFNTLFLQCKAWGLSIDRNVQIWGQIIIGDNVSIGSNVKIYKKSTICANVIIGDNVELRSNRGNAILIGKSCTINRGTLIMGQVVIGENCLIAPMCVIVGSNHVFNDSDKLIHDQGIQSIGIEIENNVWLGAQVTVLDGVCIGENSIIGAGSVVTKNIPKNSIAVGNPCRVVRER